MSINFRFPDYAWIVDSTDLGQFLDLAFANDFGEIWLYNNDLQMLLQYPTFADLYLGRVVGRHKPHINAVKILLRPDLIDPALGLEKSLKEIPDLCARLGDLYHSGKGGENNLSIFHFGVASPDLAPELLRSSGTSDNSWIFYAQRGNLDSGVAMLRHRNFPFQLLGQDENRFAIVWLLQRYATLNDRLKKAFLDCFRDESRFFRLAVKSSRNSSFDFTVKQSSFKKSVKLQKNELRHSSSLTLGDHADVAVIAAIPEEMAVFKEVLARDESTIGTVRRVPIQDHYEYVTFATQTGVKKILLTEVGTQGSIPAAIRTWDMLLHWRPRHVILVGVAGGDPKDENIALGDVMIGKYVIGYERGKVVNGEFKKEPSHYDADDILLKSATNSVSAGSWTGAIPNRPDGSNAVSKIHHDVGIASGSKLVVDDAFFFNLQEAFDRKIKAVEMEADGVGCACDSFRDVSVKMLVIKGVMDKCNNASRDMDTQLRHKWMMFAARAASTAALEVIRLL